MKSLILSLFVFGASMANADGFSFNYGAAAGTNSAQGFHYTFFVQLGTELQENLMGGLGAYYSAGEEPQHDREYGFGPFAHYTLPLSSFLAASLRQEINYVNLNDPIRIKTNPDVYTHENEVGVASSTQAGINVFIGSNLSVSAGYRLVVGITNQDLDDGRSGPYFGLGFSF